MMQHTRKYILWLIVGLFTVALILIALIYSVYFRTKNVRYFSAHDAPARKVGIIFGARIYRNGNLSPFLRDRVNGGIELLNTGKVEKLLMSGDNRTKDYDEVTAMKKYALSQGVPEDKIVLDYAGFSTYESCYRAKEIFEVDSAVVVSQNYHIPRAVFACRKLGIDAVALGAPDWDRYPDQRFRSVSREYLANLKMLWYLYVTHPEPTFLGEKEPIS